MDGWMDGMGGWVDGWMDGWIYILPFRKYHGPGVDAACNRSEYQTRVLGILPGG